MEERIQLLFLMSKLHVRWDPPPDWIKITREEMEKLRGPYDRFEKRIADAETELYADLNRVLGAGKITSPEKVMGPEKMADMPER